MLKNFFKLTFRNLGRNKGFTFINIAGLAIGMASAILILLWILNETSYDNFHANKDRIYELWNRSDRKGSIGTWNTTPKVAARIIEKDYPEVEMSVRVNWQSSYLFSIGDKRLTADGNIVDSNFLQMFTFPLLKGDPKSALNDMHNILLTQKMALKLFGTEDVMGKVLKLDNKDNFTVTGLLKDLPVNSRFNFEYLLPWSYLRSTGGDDESWGNNSTRTYVMLRKNATLASIAPKLDTIRAKYDQYDPYLKTFLYPMSRWQLHSSFKEGVEDGGKIVFVRLFGIVAAFILLIACINFMNLSTARSERRAKEVGIRKVVGAQKFSLISQFIGESIVIALMAGIIALVIVALCLPGFNTLTNKKLFIDFSNPLFWLAGIGFVVFTGLLAGSYPAFFLSSFRPVSVLKGTFKKANALITPRKVLVVLQFTFAIMLIICTIIVRQQINYAQRRESGYDKNNLMYHFLTGDLEKNYQLVKNDLISQGVATSVTKTSAPLTQGWSNSWGFEWPGKDPQDKTIVDRYVADEDLVKTAGFTIVKGRDFNLKEFSTDSTGVLINESAAKLMKLDKDPLGKIIKDNGIDWHVVGVFKDFILQSPYSPTVPMVIEGHKLGWFNVINIRLNPNQSNSKNIATAERIFKKYNPEYPFDFKFIDEEYAKKFDDEKRTGTLAGLFAGLTIFISCLGLFGLATYMAENRIREIGVRKVLGASVTGITSLLSKDFLKLVIISFVVAAPIAWWAMHNWLKDYEYRTPINWWVFALAGGLSVVIAILTVSYQAIKAATANPTKSLRTE
ncbi:ABC transporter permease [Pollutibacter soli]|uniref:ABC transporter permease n=1 Tax=Pollutibacter soli TaxID=3034157 RepID=UPI0030138178